MEKKKITLKTLSEYAGVSVASVSRVLNNEPLVSDSLRLAVMRAVEDLNYDIKPKQTFSQRKRIAVIVRDMMNEAYAPIMKGIMDVAKRYSVEILMYELDSEPGKTDALLSSVLESHVDGIVTSLPSDGLTPLMEDLLDRKFPLVFLSSNADLLPREDASVITVNSEEGIASAVKYLVDLGHRDILLLGAEDIFDVVRKSYLQVLHSVEMIPKMSMLCRISDSFSEAFSLVTDRCKNRDFTAIYASTGILTMGAWRALREQGVKVPQEVSVVGFGDPHTMGALSITALTEPWVEIGRNAMYAIMEKIDGVNTVPARIVLRDSLILGNSCRKI